MLTRIIGAVIFATLLWGTFACTPKKHTIPATQSTVIVPPAKQAPAASQPAANIIAKPPATTQALKPGEPKPPERVGGMRVSDADHTITFSIMSDGSKCVKATDNHANGKVIFDGPVDTEEQFMMVPPEIRKKVAAFTIEAKP